MTPDCARTSVAERAAITVASIRSRTMRRERAAATCFMTTSLIPLTLSVRDFVTCASAGQISKGGIVAQPDLSAGDLDPSVVFEHVEQARDDLSCRSELGGDFFVRGVEHREWRAVVFEFPHEVVG